MLRCPALGFARHIGHDRADAMRAVAELTDLAWAAFRAERYALRPPAVDAEARALVALPDAQLVARMYDRHHVLREVVRRELVDRGVFDAGLFAIGMYGPPEAEAQAVALLQAALR